MKIHLAILLVTNALFSAAAIAEPCVGSAYDRPFPGAVDVSMHYVDVPATQFPGVWQEGSIEGHFYQIFANRLAVLQKERSAPSWSINVNCQQRPCTIEVAGKPPETAMTISKKLEQCLVPPEIKVAASQEAQKSPSDKAPSKSAPAKPTDKKQASTKSEDKKPAPAKTADAKPADKKPAPAKPEDKKPAPAKTADAKPADTKPALAKPAPTTKALAAPAPAA
ncbi:MAG: hypothetical protein ACEQSU_15650, partial [Microgenomates group bacterium]